jgi:tetratricopeptide (TPR) repeat protein
MALDAARRGARLWPTPPWGERAAALEQRWVDDRIANAERLFEGGDSGAAMTDLQAAKAIDPERSDSALLEAKIYFSGGQLDKAEARLIDISTLPEAVLLQGQIGENRGDWQSAMESYSSLPEDYPGRSESLERAQTRWRMTLLPDYARVAMATENLTRVDLAVVLVSVLPRLETMPGGAVPVMSDIVDQPGQREIITVVRLGIMTADRRGHRFNPDSEANLETVRQAVHKSRSLLGLPTPKWCTDRDVLGSGCVSIPSPPSGGSVVNAVLDPTSGATP